MQPRDVDASRSAQAPHVEDVVTVTAAKKPAARKSPATRKPSRRAPVKSAAVDLHELGARVVSVFGPFASRVLIEMPVGAAAEMFPKPLADSGRKAVTEAVTRDLEAIGRRDARLAESALAASALALAYELDHPYNSATSKSMCARSLLDALDRLRELLPPDEEKDGLDDLSARRAARLSGRSAS